MPEQGARHLTDVSDLRHRVRRLHWFRQSFRKSADDIGRRFNFSYAIDDRALADAFFHWASVFESERANSQRNLRDFAIYAGGLMLRELCCADPAHRTGTGQFDNLIPPEPMAKICDFWPEGFLYATYCLTLVRAILEQDFDVRTSDNPLLKDLRVWEIVPRKLPRDSGPCSPLLRCLYGRRAELDISGTLRWTTRREGRRAYG